MKQLTCEMCGSTDLLKDGGVFVCQSCGCKYSVEEAKKMMIEGSVDVSGSTVKVDNSDKLNKLLILATRARKEDNTEDAKKYYEMAMIEDPNNWESAFYAAYYRLLDSPVNQLPETIKTFNSRAISSLELIFSNEFHGNVSDTVNDFFDATKNLYTQIVNNEKTRREKKDSEFLVLAAQYALGQIRKDYYDELKAEYTNTLHASFYLFGAMRATILKLCLLAENHKEDMNISNLDSMYYTCDYIYMVDAQNVAGMENYLSFTEAALTFERMRKAEFPYFTSIGVGTLLQVGEKMKNGSFPNPKGQEIIDCINNYRDEFLKAQVKIYWDAHPQEYAALNAEEEDIRKQILKLNEQHGLAVSAKKQEVSKIDEDINLLTVQLKSLGMFKSKEKKALQAKIDEIRSVRDSVNDAIRVETSELNRNLAPLNIRLKEINNIRSTVPSDNK